MSEASGRYRSAEDLDPELQAAVLQWVLSVADTKQTIGLQYSHWVTGTPALEAAVGSAALTQDELGHARSLHALLRDFPAVPTGVGAENDLEARSRYFVPASLQPRWDSWYQVVAVNVVLDRALSEAVNCFATSTLAPLAGRAAKILQEEQFHRIFGDSWLKRLGEREERVRAKVQTQLNWAWQLADRWLGPDTDPVVTILFTHGVLSAGPGEMRRRWLAKLKPVLADCGFEVAPMTTDWSGWDSRCRQLEDA